MARQAVAQLESVSPFSWSKVIDEESKRAKEAPEAAEARLWRERIHADADGNCFIPPMAFKKCLEESAKFLKEKIKGKGNSTWTKHFEAGVLVTDPLFVGVKKDDVKGERLFVPSDGQPGGGKRVWKIFPFIPEWKGSVVFHVLDDEITEDIFKSTLENAGSFIGVGRFRPKNRGFYGRFAVKSIKWK